LHNIDLKIKTKNKHVRQTKYQVQNIMDGVKLSVVQNYRPTHHSGYMLFQDAIQLLNLIVCKHVDVMNYSIK